MNAGVKYRQMIRAVQPSDAPAIAAIYADYVRHTTISFELTPPTVQQMQERIEQISAHYPYFVWEEADGAISGYCYAHGWKERAAYAHTWETTVYLAPHAMSKGLGTVLMHQLITACRAAGAHVLIACITDTNAPSRAFHEKLGFSKVSHFPQVGYKFGHRLDVTDYALCLHPQTYN